jgi:xylose isomerase
MTQAYYHILSCGGLSKGGTNFDAKLRRQSLDPEDLLIAHVGGMDCCARALKATAKMVEDGNLSTHLNDRYSGWEGDYAKQVLNGSISLDQIADRAIKDDIRPNPVSGK